MRYNFAINKFVAQKCGKLRELNGNRKRGKEREKENENADPKRGMKRRNTRKEKL